MFLSPVESASTGSLLRRDRIAFFMHGFEMGGAQKMTISLAGELAQRGIPTDIVVASDGGALRELVPEAIRIVVLESNLLSLARSGKRRTRVRAAIPALARYIRQERPTALIGAANHASIATVIAHRLAKVPQVKLLLRATNPLSPTGEGGSGLKRAVARLVFPRAHRIIAVSQPVAEDHAEVTGLSLDRIAVIPEPVVDQSFSDRLAAPPFHPWLTTDAPLVTAIGRLVRQKDYPTLLRAFRLVRAERPDARLLIVGDGPERQKLTALRDALGLRQAVEFAGTIGNPLPALRFSRSLVLSSQWEGLGVTVVEALAAGCNVVATETPAVSWVLRSGAFGRLSPVGNEHELAAGILASLSPAPREQRLQERAMDFTSGEVALRYIDLLGELRI